MARFSKAASLAKGKKLVESAKKVPPKFSVKDFLLGVKSTEEKIADDFLGYVQKYFYMNLPDSKLLSEFTGEEVSSGLIIKGLKSKKGVVFVINEKAIHELSYKELWSLMEYGRKDKGLLPHPILRVCFESYKPRFKKLVKQYLLK